ncbi:MAG: hypothetical protein QW222_07800 [Candidatus Bathyarchaeia archaeon]
MPRPRKYGDTVVKSFCVERGVYGRLRAALAVQGKSISEEVNELLKRRLAELEGASTPSVGADSCLCMDDEGMRLLRDGKMSFPLKPNQIIFIGTIEPLKPIRTAKLENARAK